MVVDVVVDDEVLRTLSPIPDKINAGFPDVREVELAIIVLEHRPPKCDRTGEHSLRISVLRVLEYGGFLERLVLAVQLDDCHLGLVRHISNLGESDIGFAYPTFYGIRLHSPRNHLSGFPGRNHAP